MRCANPLTSPDWVLDSASLPASTSTWLAVTTIAAICGSVGAPSCPQTAAQASVRDAAQRTIIGFIFWSPQCESTLTETGSGASRRCSRHLLSLPKVHDELRTVLPVA